MTAAGKALVDRSGARRRAAALRVGRAAATCRRSAALIETRHLGLARDHRRASCTSRPGPRSTPGPALASTASTSPSSRRRASRATSAFTRASTAGRRSGGCSVRPGGACAVFDAPYTPPGAGLRRDPGVRLGHLGALSGAAIGPGSACCASSSAPAAAIRSASKPTIWAFGALDPADTPKAPGRRGPVQGATPPAG